MVSVCRKKSYSPEASTSTESRMGPIRAAIGLGFVNVLHLQSTANAARRSEQHTS